MYLSSIKFLYFVLMQDCYKCQLESDVSLPGLRPCGIHAGEWRRGNLRPIPGNCL